MQGSDSFTVGEPSDQWREYRGAPAGADRECRGWRREARDSGGRVPMATRDEEGSR